MFASRPWPQTHVWREYIFYLHDISFKIMYSGCWIYLVDLFQWICLGLVAFCCLLLQHHRKRKWCYWVILPEGQKYIILLNQSCFSIVFHSLHREQHSVIFHLSFKDHKIHVRVALLKRRSLLSRAFILLSVVVVAFFTFDGAQEIFLLNRWKVVVLLTDCI